MDAVQTPLVADAERRLIAQAGMPFPINERPPVNTAIAHETMPAFDKNIPLSLLVATQRDLNPDVVQKMIHADDLEPIETVLHQGRHYINDGHHRAVAANYRGDTTVPARVVDAAP